MSAQSTEELVAKKCVPCEGGVPRYSAAEAQEQLQKLQGWEMSHDGQRIRKKWTVKNFVAGINFFTRVAELAICTCLATAMSRSRSGRTPSAG